MAYNGWFQPFRYSGSLLQILGDGTIILVQCKLSLELTITQNVPTITNPATEQRCSPHLNNKENNTPPFVNMKPNSYRIPFALPNIISHEAVNSIPNKVYDELDDLWLPDNFTVSNPTARYQNVSDLDIDFFLPE